MTNDFLRAFSSIGVRPSDGEDAVLQKRFLVYQAVLMSCGGIAWGALAFAFGRVWQSAVPFGYVLLSGLNLAYFRAARNFPEAYRLLSILHLLPFYPPLHRLCDLPEQPLYHLHLSVKALAVNLLVCPAFFSL